MKKKKRDKTVKVQLVFPLARELEQVKKYRANLQSNGHCMSFDISDYVLELTSRKKLNSPCIKNEII